MYYQTKIVGNTAQWTDFLELPFRLYRSDPAWVPPLRSSVSKLLDARRNPYFKGADLQKFVCYHDGRPVARAIVVINPKHWLKFGQQVAFFGFFESENDVLAVRNLFAAIDEYCAAQGAETLEGPFNPNHYSELGLLVKNFSAPAFFETYNPEYYATLLQSVGFEPVLHLHTRIIRDTAALAARADPAVFERARKAGFTIRPVNFFRLRAELDRIREVYNDAFDENWHFLPVSREEYLYSAYDLLLVTNPSLVQIVEHHGKPVGVLQFVLDVNPLLAQLRGRLSAGGFLRFLRQRFALRDIVLYAGGIKKEYRKSPAIELFVAALCGLAKRYRTIYGTWMSDANTAAIKSAERVGFVPYKWFDIYRKPINTREI